MEESHTPLLSFSRRKNKRRNRCGRRTRGPQLSRLLMSKVMFLWEARETNDQNNVFNLTTVALLWNSLGKPSNLRLFMGDQHSGVWALWQDK